MKNIFKRVLAIILMLIMAFSAIPLAVFAENSENIKDESTTEIETQSGLGIIANNLMSAEDNSDYSITSIEVSEKIATVELINSEACTLVVAIYDEKTEQMLASGVEKVEANTMSQNVEIDIATMPSKFIVKAFLLGNNYEALCKEFVSMEYTSAFDSYIEKTPDDYADEEVIIFDDTKENVDFAVLDNSVLSSEKTASMTFTYDEATKTYTFKNAIADVKNLKEGDVYYYEYGTQSNEFLLFKVKTISITGSTVKITQDENLDLEEAFKFIRIDDTSDFSEVEIDESQLGDALEAVDVTNPVPNNGVSYEDNGTFSGDFSLKYTGKSGGDSVTVKGTLGMTLKFDVKLYYDPEIFGKDHYEFEFKQTLKFSFDVSFTGKIGLDSDVFKIPVAKVPVGPFTVNADITPVFDISASVTFSAYLETCDKITADDKNGMKKHRTIDSDVNVSIEEKFEIKLGVKVKVSVKFIEIVELAVTGEGGGKFTGKETVQSDKSHTCKTCVDGEFKAYYDISLNLSITIIKKTLDFDWKIIGFSKEWKLFDFYISISRSGEISFGKGDCPNIRDLVKFGSYPQSKVTDSSLISALNSKTKTWVSYGYYTGTGAWSDGQMKPSDYMKYADITYNGVKYRAVTFSQYRPYYTGCTSSASNTNQDENGYNTNTIYYFKYEPLEWRVLDPNEGLVMCESIIDSQAYNNTIYYNSTIANSKGSRYACFQDSTCTTYANDYATSSIRDWLNDDFYNTAFTTSEKNEIKNSVQDNSCWSSSYPEFDSATTNDKIFLLSYDEVLNTEYGFSSSYSTYDTARRAQGTDYAKCQGLYVSYNGNPYWRLRSPDDDSSDACEVSSDGIVNDYYYVHSTNSGIRPALKFNLTSAISESVSQQVHSNGVAESNTETLLDLSENACEAGRDYLLLNVTGYGDDFVLTSENLLYINTVTADENGNVDTSFTPKESTEDSTTLLIGDFGKGIEVKKVTEGSNEQISVNVEDISMNYKSTVNINPDIKADTGVDYNVEVASSNPSVATVDKNGNVTGVGRGVAEITITVTDEYGNVVEDTCTVTVSFAWWQWIIVIVLFGWIWY